MFIRQSTIKWLPCYIRQVQHSSIPVAASASAIQKPELASDPLTDKFGRRHTYLRISLTEKCNLRCKYCMPSEGVTLTKKDKLLTTDELIRLSSIFVNQGVTKIRLTGGEPTVRRDIVQIIEALKSLPKLEIVAMTTNGLTLTRQLVALQKAGLDIVNISLDTLKSHKYELMARRKGFDRAMAGIDLAVQLGYNPVKINCVVMKGFNEDEIIDFVNMTKDKPVDIRFIEYMPFTGNSWKSDTLFSYKQMLETIKREWPDFKPLPNHPNDTSKAWHVPGYKGQVGFITSMSEHFCGSCNRIRLTADGNLKVCLFGNAEISLRDALRNNISEDDLVCMIGAAIRRKNKQHAGHHEKHRIQSPFLMDNIKIHMLNNKHNHNHNSIRFFSTNGFSHVDEAGRANMVDVGNKNSKKRIAKAKGTVIVGTKIIKLIQENQMKKGDVLTVAQIAGILGAKRTSELIPMCHNIPLSSVNVNLSMTETKILISAEAQCTGQTGVEMEALTAVAITALTVYDMCKAVSHSIRIEDIFLIMKEGGKSGSIVYKQEPIHTDEYYYPTHV